MRPVWTITKRELNGYFTSPLAYILLVIFLIFSGSFTFFFSQWFKKGVADLVPFFGWHPWLYLFLVPAVGMRLWAEELRLGTIELLLTMPITTFQAILGKFLASWIFLGVALALTFPLVITAGYLGQPDYGRIWCGYLGSLLLAGSFLAIASLTSALTRSQVISFVLAFTVCALLILCGLSTITDLAASWAPAWVIDALAAIGIFNHFDGLQRGIVDTRDLFYFFSIIVFCLFSTSVVLRGHRA